MKPTSTRWAVIPVLAIGVVLLAAGSPDQERPEYYHDWHALPAAQGGGGDANPLPQGSNSLFTGSGRCAGCHGSDPTGYASTTEEGEDVNPTDYWQATIMANSAKDPLWQAKVSHETSVNPSHSAELMDKCTSCHAPMGHFASVFDGNPHYSMEMLATDSLGLDGVSCNSCHQQDPDSIGKFFSGELRYVEDTIYGPFGGDPEEPPIFGAPMVSFVGYAPIYGAHVEESEFCAGCHTLVTQTVDLDGNFTGNNFVEQATYHEWLNSDYADESSPNHAECQGCHFPRLDEPVVISSNYIFLTGRTPYGLHEMVGGNTFMLELMKDNIEDLGITASAEEFDAVIDRTMESLQQESATLELFDLGVSDDTAYYEVMLTNHTGHRFPSGYPARRAYIEFVVRDADGNVRWQSGMMNDQYEISGQNADWEPHHQVLSDTSQVQVYEMVLGDVNGDVTTVLERADYALKDNRFAPLGFSTSHPSYDTTLVTGNALTDPDWNHINGEEGSGTDRVYYHIPLEGYVGALTVEARLMYQSVPPKWLEEMFAYDTPEIEWFEEKYWETGAEPVEVDRELIETVIVGLDSPAAPFAAVFPNPTSDGRIVIQNGGLVDGRVHVHDASGRRVLEQRVAVSPMEVRLPDAPGVYLVVIEGAGYRWTERVLRR